MLFAAAPSAAFVTLIAGKLATAFADKSFHPYTTTNTLPATIVDRYGIPASTIVIYDRVWVGYPPLISVMQYPHYNHNLAVALFSGAELQSEWKIPEEIER